MPANPCADSVTAAVVDFHFGIFILGLVTAGMFIGHRVLSRLPLTISRGGRQHGDSRGTGDHTKACGWRAPRDGRNSSDGLLIPESASGPRYAARGERTRVPARTRTPQAFPAQ